jgi:hypothetical protein
MRPLAESHLGNREAFDPSEERRAAEHTRIDFVPGSHHPPRGQPNWAS